jgi:MYXO-CTERM domain-containing protein
MTRSNALGLHRWLSCSLALASFAGGALSSTAAHAQVELRCPQGWTTAPPLAQGAEGQRPMVSCRKDPMLVGGLQVDVRVPQGSAEARLALQLLMEANFPPPESMPQLRDETFGTVRARVLEREEQGEGPGGTTTRVTGVVALIPVGETTVVLRAISTNARSPAMTGLRAIIPAIVGLDGAPVQWRVGLPSCPRPLSRGDVRGATPNGLRLAATCTVESEGKSVEVLESRLPARTLPEARAAIDFYRQTMERQFGRSGGTVSMDEPSPITVQGAQGFYGVIHATVTAQEAPNAPPQQLRIDRAVTVVPLDNGGHAELLATVANPSDANAVRSLTEAVIALVKLDGSQVTGITTSAAASGDGGAGEGGVSAPSERSREQPRSNFDPNAPIPDWSSATVDRPRVAQPAAQKSACGCTTPGAVDPMGAWWAMGVIAGALASRKRRP